MAVSPARTMVHSFFHYSSSFPGGSREFLFIFTGRVLSTGVRALVRRTIQESDM